MHPLTVRYDEKEKGFVHDSVVRRLAVIVRNMLPDSPTVCGLETGELAIAPIDDSDGGSDWREFVESELKRVNSAAAFDVSWFFLESYVYRLCLRELGFFSTRVDPFAHEKTLSLESAREGFVHRCAASRKAELNLQETYALLLKDALWGNRADLSVSAGVVEKEKGVGHLLRDDTGASWTHLVAGLEKAQASSEIVFVLDNCGAELLADLRLADFLLTQLNVRTVAFHCKSHPVFVSDATVPDVDAHLKWMGAVAGEAELEASLREHQKSGRFLVVEDPFYTTPLLTFPSDFVARAYTRAVLTIFKGDANYRRLLGDLPWPATTSFRQVLTRKGGVLGEAQGRAFVLAIRTCKSPVAVGLTEEGLIQANAFNPKWCLDGSAGMISFSEVMDY